MLNEDNILTSESSPALPKNRSMGILMYLTGGVAVSLTALSLPFLSPALRRICLPYVPATSKQVDNVLKALQGHSRNSKIIDLGSGDGRIVVAAAREGFVSHGVEMNPWLVLYSRAVAFKSGVRSLTAFYQRDLWKTSLVPYGAVVIFGVDEMMQELEQKLENEMESGTRVIACRFPLPNKQFSSLIGTGIDRVWVYKY